MAACTNSREAVNCIVTERCRWQEERGQDGAAVDRKTTLQGSFSSGTARDSVVGSSPTGGAKTKPITVVVGFCFVFLFLCIQVIVRIKISIGANINEKQFSKVKSDFIVNHHNLTS
jgi:hypothetical protein